VGLTRTSRLEPKAAEFADALSEVLNATLTRGVRLRAVTIPGPKPLAFVGNGLTVRNYSEGKGFKLGRSSGCPQLHMSVFYILDAEAGSDYLRVRTSLLMVALDSDMRDELLHFDYERDKTDGYPEAHMQISATSPEWERALGTSKGLSKLHFPVGGRRFRPALEDVIEFLIVERLAAPHGQGEGWRKKLDTRRKAFRRIQLAAAIRQDAGFAREVLGELSPE
jgi:hypothetical protein